MSKMSQNSYTFLHQNPPPCETEKCVNPFIQGFKYPIIRKALCNRMGPVGVVCVQSAVEILWFGHLDSFVNHNDCLIQ